MHIIISIYHLHIAIVMTKNCALIIALMQIKYVADGSYWLFNGLFEWFMNREL